MGPLQIIFKSCAQPNLLSIYLAKVTYNFTLEEIVFNNKMHDSSYQCVMQ